MPWRYGSRYEVELTAAEEGSLTLASEKRLHTAQPSLSRQIRDLEYEVGVQLTSRSVHGTEFRSNLIFVNERSTCAG